MTPILAAILAFTPIGYFDYPNAGYPATFPARANSYFVSKASIPNMSTYYWDCGVAVLEAMMERRLFGEVCESNANVVASFYGGEYQNFTDIPKGSFSAHKMFELPSQCFFAMGDPYDFYLGYDGRDYNFRDGPDVFDFEVPNLRVGRFVKPTDIFNMEELRKPGGKYGGVFWRLVNNGGPYQLLASGGMAGQHETIADAVPGFDDTMFAWGGPLPTGGTKLEGDAYAYFDQFDWCEDISEFPDWFFMSYWTWRNTEPGFTGVKFLGPGAKRPQIRSANAYFMPGLWLEKSSIMSAYVSTEEGGQFRAAFNGKASDRVQTDGTVDPSIDQNWYFSSRVFGDDPATAEFDPNFLSMTQDRALWRPWAVLNKIVDETDKTYTFGLSYRPRFWNTWKRAAGTVRESKYLVAKNVRIGKYRAFYPYEPSPDPIGAANPMRFELKDIVKSGRVTTTVDYRIRPDGAPEDARLEDVARYGRTVSDFDVEYDDAYCDSNYTYRVTLATEDVGPWGRNAWVGNTNDYTGLRYDVVLLGYRGVDEYPNPQIGHHTVDLKLSWTLSEESQAAHPELASAGVYFTEVVQDIGDYIEIKPPQFPQLIDEEILFDVSYIINVDTTSWYPWYIAEFYDPASEQPYPPIYPVIKFYDGDLASRRVSEIANNYLLAMRVNSTVDITKDPDAKPVRHAFKGLLSLSEGNNPLSPDSDCHAVWGDELYSEWDSVPEIARTDFPLDAWDFFEGVDADNWKRFSEAAANTLVTYDHQQESYARWIPDVHDTTFRVTIDVDGEVVTKCEMEWADGHYDEGSEKTTRSARGGWHLYPKIDYKCDFRGDQLKNAFQELADWSAVIDNVNMNATTWKFKTKIEDN